MLKTSPDGLAVMHYFESCRLKAYPDPATGGAPWTIGWGDTGPDVVRGLVITQQEADQRLTTRLTYEFEPMVRAAVTVDLNQRQFDALVSIVYNTGPGLASRPGRPGRDGVIRLASGLPSTLLRRVNAGEFQAAADAFLAWNRGNGQVMLGLRRRRAAERALFLGATGARAIEIGKAVV